MTTRSFEGRRVDLSVHDNGSWMGLGLKTAAFVLFIKGLSDAALAEEELGSPSKFELHGGGMPTAWGGLLESDGGEEKALIKARQKEFDSALENNMAHYMAHYC